MGFVVEEEVAVVAKLVALVVLVVAVVVAVVAAVVVLVAVVVAVVAVAMLVAGPFSLQKLVLPYYKYFYFNRKIILPRSFFHKYVYTYRIILLK